MSRVSSKVMIGRWVYLDIPDVALYNVKAKVDTGAFRSSLHCEFIGAFAEGDETYLKIRTTDMSGNPISDEPMTVRQSGTVRVRSSNGEIQQRPIVMLDVIINGEQHTAEFTLTNRGDMKFPILLGRKLLRNAFVVDVSLDDPEDPDQTEDESD